MTTSTKIKSSRAALEDSLARYSRMLDDMSRQTAEAAVEDSRAITPALLVGSGLALVVRALLDVSDSIDSIAIGLHDVATRNPGQGR